MEVGMMGSVSLLQYAKYNAQKNMEVGIIAMSAKFASKLYTPFRDVCNSSPQYYNRENYQLPIESTELAMRAIERDLKEGADYTIIKPITMNLDVVVKAKQNFPTALIMGYIVLGEYCMIENC